jgi:CHAT domain-containing protein/tetratricopeptide (TPR) repeat protein
MPIRHLGLISTVLALTLAPRVLTQSTMLIVEQIDERGSARRAGILPGDHLADWRQGPASGPLHTPFDLSKTEIEQADRGPTEIRGTRAGVSQVWTLESAPWGVTVRPALEGALSAYQEGAAVAATSPADAATRWRAAADAAPAHAAWLLFTAAQAYVRSGSWDAADATFGEALGRAGDAGAATVAIRKAWADAYLRRSQWTQAQQRLDEALADQRAAGPNTMVEAGLLVDVGRLLASRGESAGAHARFQAAAAIQAAAAPEGLAHASSLQGIGGALINLGRLDESVAFLQRALAIRERLAPGTLDVAASLHNLARAEQERGHLDAAADLYRRALTVTEAVAPRSAQWASTVSNLGNVVRTQGDLDESDRLLQAALEVRMALAPDSLDVAGSLNNLSHSAILRGDFVKAEDYLRRSLEMKERLAPGSATVANTIENLGLLSHSRRDLPLAEHYFRRGLALREKLSPNTMYHAQVLHNLGLILEERGDLVRAERYQRASLAMRRRERAGDVYIAESLNNLGVISEKRQQFGLAERQYQQALAAQRRVSDGTLSVAAILRNLGDVARKRARWATAEGYYKEALEIRAHRAPGTAVHAESLYDAALVARHRGDMGQASEHLTAALDAVERQIERFGAPQDTSASFRAEYSHYYREFIDLQIQQKHSAAAFHALERSRSQLMLELLRMRVLHFRELPAEVELRRRRNAVEYDRVQSEIQGLAPSTADTDLAPLQSRLRELSAERAYIVDRIRAAAPHVATLQFPESLGLEAARAALDPGTVMLSYSVGEAKTFLFVVSAAGSEPALTVLPIPAGEAALRRRVTALRSAIQTRTPAGRQSLAVEARALFQLLIGPASAAIERAQRIVVIPDGPLHILPFPVLLSPEGRYLIQLKPVHTTLSATVYADVKKRRRPAEAFDTELVAFGAPIYQAGQAPLSHSNTTPRGSALAPLPFSLTEVQAIAKPWGTRATAYIGADATEERAQAVRTGVRYLHFAVHGLLDEVFPLNSALALTTPVATRDGGANGFLQAWELYERVRWDADLVVLSACDSALGKEFAGEGLMGLTRAIQFAGARAVLASLWSVDDRRTAQFMERFYTHLRAGTSTDEALRAAQIEFITSPTTTPFHWAAFSLNGDWR